MNELLKLAAATIVMRKFAEKPTPAPTDKVRPVQWPGSQATPSGGVGPFQVPRAPENPTLPTVTPFSKVTPTAGLDMSSNKKASPLNALLSYFS